MKTLLIAGVGAILLIGAVLRLRHRRLLRKQISPHPKRTNTVEGLDQGGLHPSPDPDQPAAMHRVGQLKPMDPQQRRQMLQYLKSAYAQGAQARLDAMEDMVAWGQPACIPLLRRGLRDADLRVVGLAARGLERFRGPRHPRKRLKHPPQHRRRPQGHHPSTPV